MGNNEFNEQSPLGAYFNSNAEGLLQNVILNGLLGNPMGPDDYWKEFTFNTGYEQGGYGVDLGYNRPNPLHQGDKLDWLLTGKIPLDF